MKDFPLILRTPSGEQQWRVQWRDLSESSDAAYVDYDSHTITLCVTEHDPMELLLTASHEADHVALPDLAEPAIERAEHNRRQVFLSLGRTLGLW